MDLAAWFQELRRRRVIRALLAWGLFSFAVLQIVEPVQHALGLPEWVAEGRGGGAGRRLPRLRRARLGLRPDEARDRAHGTSGGFGSGPRRRGAEGVRPALAMVAVGALLGAAVAGLAGWHLWGRTPALGPDGRITVAVADFVNETKDGDLDGLSGQLITSLEQSQRLRVLTRSRMVDVLRQIGKPSVPVVDEILGREMALAAGVRALVVATIRRFDQLYAIDLKVLDPATSEYFFTLKEEREGKAAIPAMLDRLSEKAREKLRETRPRSARRGWPSPTPPRGATRRGALLRGAEVGGRRRPEPPSRSYREGGGGRSSLRAGTLPHRLPGRVRRPIPRKRETPMEAAYREIDRVPAKERMLFQAWKAHVDGRTADAHALYARAAEAYPLDKEVLYLAGDLYLHEGNAAEALPWFERAVALDPAWPEAQGHLIQRCPPGARPATRRRWPAPGAGWSRLPGSARARTLDRALSSAGRRRRPWRCRRRPQPRPIRDWTSAASLASSLIIADRFEEAEAHPSALCWKLGEGRRAARRHPAPRHRTRPPGTTAGGPPRHRNPA